jgi:tRNA uridine 5-carboxymethylaminomethyl modification enzyme
MTSRVVVVGGGHAGAEAALAASRMGADVVLVTMSGSTIGAMSCNPAVGGVAKGVLVREIDALGGAMGECADASAIQFRMLNRSKGPAVWGPRIQADSKVYPALVRRALDDGGIGIVEDEVVAIAGTEDRASGVVLSSGRTLEADAVVLAPGTFLGGMLYRGEERWRGGRAGDGSSEALLHHLESRGFHVERFKTGTSPRVLSSTIDYDRLQIQAEDGDCFRFGTREPRFPRMPARAACWTTRTGKATRDAAIRAADRSPLLGGAITGRGPRYCPSFEQKAMVFPEREEHPVFVEPMGLGSRLVYLNGLSTSLPRGAQEEMVRSLPGFGKAEIVRWGYAVEYAVIHHSEFGPGLEARRCSNLFFAGQVCGTSGYEEAAGLGLLAGRNAAAAASGREQLVMDRRVSYIGVMAGDISSRGVTEPYRLFSSRAENRLDMRADNADRRLLPVAVSCGTARAGDASRLETITEEAVRASRLLAGERIGGARALEICRRPGTDPQRLIASIPGLQTLSRDTVLAVILDERYRGYIEKAGRRSARLGMLSGISISGVGSFASVEEISWEAREALEAARPSTLAEAEALPGVRPSDIEGLMIHISRGRST